MDKNRLKDWIFELFNEHDDLFSDISLHDDVDALFVKCTNGRWFSITVNAMTEQEAMACSGTFNITHVS